MRIDEAWLGMCPHAFFVAKFIDKSRHEGIEWTLLRSQS